MSEVTKPIALDESLNTTESTPRNIADVVADETGDLVTQATAIVTKLQALINAVKPNASDIPLDPITGMTANNVQLGISELKGTLDLLSNFENVFFKAYKNQTTFEIPITAQASASHFGTYALFNGNCDVMLVIEVGSSSHVKVISASNRTFTLNVTDSKATITASAGLWGMTFIIGYFE